jgi:hypothetical protein
VWASSAGAQEGDGMKSPGRSLTPAAIEKGPSRGRGATGETRRKRSSARPRLNPRRVDSIQDRRFADSNFPAPTIRLGGVDAPVAGRRIRALPAIAPLTRFPRVTTLGPARRTADRARRQPKKSFRSFGRRDLRYSMQLFAILTRSSSAMPEPALLKRAVKLLVTRSPRRHAAIASTEPEYRAPRQF